MARQLTGIEPEPQYRAVIFYKYSGMHDLPLEIYTDRDGRIYDYHRVYVFGPYEKPGTAKSMVKRDIRYAEQYGYRDHRTYDKATNTYTTFPVSDSEGLVESSLPLWGLHA